MTKASRDAARRGVLLLIVLGMLAMFALVGITFVVLTSHERRGAEAARRVEQYADPADDLLNQAMLQTLRGTDTAASVLRPHSLLEDLYGNDVITGTITGATAAGALVVDCNVTGVDLADFARCIGGTLTLCEGPQDAMMVPNNAAGINCVVRNAGAGIVQIELPPRPRPLVMGEHYLSAADIQAYAAANPISFVVSSPQGVPMGGSVIYPGNPQLIEMTIPNGRQHVGKMVTMLDGPAAGLTTRIVSFSGANPNIVHALPFPNGAQAAASNHCLFNGTPFSGTGFGYNAHVTGANVQLTQVDPDTNLPAALLPNSPINGATLGGANEDYDAADFQNMLLGMQVPQTVGAVPAGTTPIPSLHRPALVNYWFHQLESGAVPGFTWPSGAPGTPERMQCFVAPFRQDTPGVWFWGWDNSNIQSAYFLVALKRRILLRPSPEDHPEFTGSNPNFYPLWDGYTPIDLDGDATADVHWDVDNDGDGIMDSIWVDLGMPARPTKDGRLYKPLFAILCVDMDGRINLNAHGTLAQANPTGAYYTPDTLASAIIPDASGTPQNTMPVSRGQAAGPAEVNPLALFAVPSMIPTLAELTQAFALLTNRYGANALPGKTTAPAAVATDNPPGDPLFANKVFDFPPLYETTTTLGTRAYGSPIDLKGEMAVGLDLRGQPLYLPLGVVNPLPLGPATPVYRAENPYELNLSNAAKATVGPGAIDTPFSVAELERLLRPYDADAGTLPDRITSLAPLLLGDGAAHPTRVREVTTESWSIPCPGVALPPELRDDANVQAWMPTRKANHLVDLVRAKVLAENATTLNNPNDGTQINTLEHITSHLVPAEMFAGLKMDLNRRFGDGMDNNGNGVVDEPSEIPDQMPDLDPVDQTPFYNAARALSTYPFYATNDITINGSDLIARQIYARHMYVQMLALMHYNPAAANAEAVARQVAQWTVNIIDFRDRDAIMTWFEYDIDPFTDSSAPPDGDAWDVDDKITTNDGEPRPHVVWGCERPELLITETLAFHDRRTEDLSEDGGLVSKGKDDHTDLDQRRRPQGSLFIELYNPSGSSEALPAELYANVGGNWGIDLRAMQGDSPVWQMLIYDAAMVNDPDDPTLAATPNAERSIYFSAPGGTFNCTYDGRRYYPDPAAANLPPISLLLPGRYAVVGPGTGGGANATYVGYTGTPTDPISNYTPASTRRIVLTPNADPNAAVKQVDVFGNGSNDDLAALSIQSPIAVVINPPPTAAGNPLRLSVSELVDGYAPYENVPLELYNPVRQQPIDKLSNPDWNTALRFDGTTPRFRFVYLRRLANPLLPYNQDTNPYRVVDKAQIDLTAFNGLPLTVADPDVLTTKNYAFFTRERGEDEEGAPGTINNLWPQEIPTAVNAPNCPVANQKTVTATHHFHEPFGHTLGYLNEGFGAPQNIGPGSPYNGCPPMPFPWLTWLNRPFASEMELMLVPQWRSSQLLEAAPPPPRPGVIPPAYFGIAAATPDTYVNQYLPFPQLINFFYDDPAATAPFDSWKLHRLLDFVRVPSPFVGTELQGNPANFAIPGQSHRFHPPFNWLPNYREPGRININTIATSDVWNGLMNFGAMPTWNTVAASRRGYGAGGDIFAMDNTYPTQFANPFRSAAGRYQVPLAGMGTSIGEEVHATLLRRHAAGNNAPLFERTSANAYDDTNRNPAFRYQPLDRLGSMVTTQSNVYAVWITVGYFEVKPWTWVQIGTNPAGVPINAQGLTQAQFIQVYPDAYQLRQELGADTGETKRHRAFYIIDRSIPVGFQRGRDYNVEKAVLLKRYIE
jgi:hypothetical protein